MIEALISSRTRIKLLLKLFLNSSNRAYLRGLEDEFGESSNAIRIELKRLENAGMIKSEASGNKKLFKANTKHPLFDEIHNILRKYVGIDAIVDRITNQIGDVERVYLVGDFAKGINSNVVDIEFVGHNFNKNYLMELLGRVEEAIGKKIKYVLYSPQEMDVLPLQHNKLLIWNK